MSTTDFINTLAATARREALLRQVCNPREPLTISRLQVLCSGKHGAELSQLTVGDVIAHSAPPPKRTRDEVDAEILDVFQRAGAGVWLASGPVRKALRLERWAAQAGLRRLVEAGSLERSGETGGTCYRLAEYAAVGEVDRA